ncbi:MULTISPECIES: ribonuclease Z [unclassified Bacillus (in: firmicutes)]|uniref:ribonuclease Z n=1 Tax=unclassified Bacillus (in: firmicutes) TaxID=185979 RepID=UPI000BEF5AA8|nr:MULTISPECIES: ribonuclease Z [unclassified Bacillus (in: firmicutes)]PEJ52107.1 ribonuclease Z [Bacillus sp. AFS002410]PEL11204.1 ribonuclease Z [Bacillus sp. AFS017336]
MKLVFLGTGAGMPSKGRNVTSIALQLLEERGVTWLFDCGEATQHQILHTPIRPRRIEKIFITHCHGDHIFGLPGLLSSRTFLGGEDLLTIYGPKGIKEYVETSFRISGTYLKYPIKYIETTEGIIFEDDQFIVQAIELEHGIQSFGYQVIEKDLPGELNVEELKKIDVKPGPIYKFLKEGKTVTLEDGRVLNGKDFIGTSKKGRKIAIAGDTRITNKSNLLARGMDLVVHESTFADDESTHAYDYFHTTSTQIANVAKSEGIQTLYLTHISARYQGDSSIKLLNEAREIFENTYIANDFDEYEIKRKE